MGGWVENGNVYMTVWQGTDGEMVVPFLHNLILHSGGLKLTATRQQCDSQLLWATNIDYMILQYLPPLIRCAYSRPPCALYINGLRANPDKVMQSVSPCSGHAGPKSFCPGAANCLASASDGFSRGGIRWELGAPPRATVYHSGEENIWNPSSMVFF